MELALYCPVYGYYEKEGDKPGRRGDYFTSVSVGRLFGELLAFQFCEWLKGIGSPAEAAAQPGECHGSTAGCHGAGQPSASGVDPGGGVLQLVEAGAHQGDLAADILGWIHAQRPELSRRIKYWIVEPSERRQAWQLSTLARFGNQVCWAASLSELSTSQGNKEGAGHPSGIRGVIFSNELFDSMPAHRFGWDATRQDWFEWGVGWQAGRFAWEPLKPGGAERWKAADTGWAELAALLRSAQSTLDSALASSIPDSFASLAGWMPDGFTIEVCPAARTWWRQAAALLDVGRLMTIDYGSIAEEFLRPERQNGTLRAYYRHQQNLDPLSRAGEMDLTAHVNFSTLIEAGEEAGLVTEAWLDQSQFLTGIWQQIQGRAESSAVWPAEINRQFHTLTHPQHLGRAFRTLVQSRAVSGRERPSQNC